MGYELVRKVWTSAQFKDYFQGVNTRWASSVTMHHTYSPSLEQRPVGLLKRHMDNLKYFYKVKLGWSRGPHLFVDDDEILGMSSLYRSGTHARSFNKTSIGIEVLGNYDDEDPLTGRGLACWTTAAKLVGVILNKTGLSPSGTSIKFHRDDPKTSKTCPGTKVTKAWFVEMVIKEMEDEKNDANLTNTQRITIIEDHLKLS